MSPCAVCNASRPDVCLGAVQAQRSALEREATTVLAKSAGAAQMVCTFSGVIINVDEARQRDHKSGRNYACAPPLLPASFISSSSFANQLWIVIRTFSMGDLNGNLYRALLA